MIIGPIPTINKLFSIHTIEWDRRGYLGLDPVSITLFNDTYWVNLIISFDFSEGIISYFKQSAATFSSPKQSDENEHNKQELLLYWKTYNLEAPSNDF